jgi:trehalose-6-phosphate synthase
MSEAERERRHRGLLEIVTARDPGDWIDEQLDDIAARRGTQR